MKKISLLLILTVFFSISVRAEFTQKERTAISVMNATIGECGYSIAQDENTQNFMGRIASEILKNRMVSAKDKSSNLLVKKIVGRWKMPNGVLHYFYSIGKECSGKYVGILEGGKKNQCDYVVLFTNLKLRKIIILLDTLKERKVSFEDIWVFTFDIGYNSGRLDSVSIASMANYEHEKYKPILLKRY